MHVLLKEFVVVVVAFLILMSFAFISQERVFPSSVEFVSSFNLL